MLWHPDRAREDATGAMIELMVERMAQINIAKDALVEATSDPLWPHSPPPEGGQRGSDPARPRGVFTIRSKWFEGTISGLKRGELTPRSVEDQLLAKCGELSRSIEAYAIGLEMHKNPSDPNYDQHIHFVLKVTERLHHNSSE